MKDFTILTVGWEPDFIDCLLTPIANSSGIKFIHGLVGDAGRLVHVRKKYPHAAFLALSKNNREPLPPPDYELLANLEGTGVPTIKMMVLGDPYIRHRPEKESFSYATLLARSLRKNLLELQPDIVLASFDCIHSGISLAVAKSLNIPWVALTFPVIPDNLTGFCNGLTPDALLPLSRPVDDVLRREAETLIRHVRTGQQKVVAYKAPASLQHWVRQYIFHASNFIRRVTQPHIMGLDRYGCPTLSERFHDIARRSINSLRLPTATMLKEPPSKRFIYYPFHMAPESMIDTWAPFYQDQIAFLAQISIAVPADTELVVKLHFSDPASYSRAQLAALMRRPGLHVASPFAPSRPFLEKAALVAGITGTSNLEAALRGKPVLLFGDSPYAHFPRSERAARPDQLPDQIRRMLTLPRPSDEEIIEAYATYMARYMPGHINDWGQPLEKADILRYDKCFGALRAYLENPVNRTNWYRQSPFGSLR